MAKNNGGLLGALIRLGCLCVGGVAFLGMAKAGDELSARVTHTGKYELPELDDIGDVEDVE